MLPGPFCVCVSHNSASLSKLGECSSCSAFDMEVGQGCSAALRAQGPVHRGGQVRPGGSAGRAGRERGEGWAGGGEKLAWASGAAGTGLLLPKCWGEGGRMVRAVNDRLGT